MTPFAGIVWRILFADQVDDPLAPARAPEGRFHYGGQAAIYTSLNVEGAGVAIQRYLAADDGPRVIVPIRISASAVLDLRAAPVGVTPPTSVVWQDNRALGQRAPTWDISDDARQQGAQGILYASRSRPDLSHLVLLGAFGPDVLKLDGPAQPWPLELGSQDDGVNGRVT